MVATALFWFSEAPSPGNLGGKKTEDEEDAEEDKKEQERQKTTKSARRLSRAAGAGRAGMHGRIACKAGARAWQAPSAPCMPHMHAMHRACSHYSLNSISPSRHFRQQCPSRQNWDPWRTAAGCWRGGIHQALVSGCWHCAWGQYAAQGAREEEGEMKRGQ